MMSVGKGCSHRDSIDSRGIIMPNHLFLASFVYLKYAQNEPHECHTAYIMIALIAGVLLCPITSCISCIPYTSHPASTIHTTSSYFPTSSSAQWRLGLSKIINTPVQPDIQTSKQITYLLSGYGFRL